MAATVSNVVTATSLLAIVLAASVYVLKDLQEKSVTQVLFRVAKGTLLNFRIVTFRFACHCSVRKFARKCLSAILLVPPTVC